MRAFLGLRRDHPALGYDAAFELILAVSGKCPFVHVGRSGRERTIVVINQGKRGQSVSPPLLEGAEVLRAQRASFAGRQLSMSVMSSGICLIAGR